jgi:uncharacterized membrane protein YjgN (DUF898 family)
MGTSQTGGNKTASAHDAGNAGQVYLFEVRVSTRVRKLTRYLTISEEAIIEAKRRTLLSFKVHRQNWALAALGVISIIRIGDAGPRGKASEFSYRWPLQ